MHLVRSLRHFWIVPLLAGTLAFVTTGKAAAQTAPLGLHDPIQSVTVVNGSLVATTIQGQQVPMTLSAQRVAGGGRCPVLNLALGPIHLDVLGLVVDTSAICLDVTAVRGALLGDLLCSVARLLDRGVPLATILNQLTAAQLQLLTASLRDLANGALNELNDAIVQQVRTQNACTVLDLSIGPLTLNLLGLEVQLDNCAEGPLTVTVTAVPGSGNLLGNLLCGVLGGVGVGTTLSQILQAVLGGILGALG